MMVIAPRISSPRDHRGCLVNRDPLHFGRLVNVRLPDDLAASTGSFAADDGTFSQEVGFVYDLACKLPG
jgi:hypothetical protein